MIESGDIVKWAGRDGDFSVIGIYDGYASLRKIGEVNKPSYNANVNDLTVIQRANREYRYPLTSSILRRAISFGAITAEQANSLAVIEAAEEVAYNHSNDEEIGSSDMTFILKEFLDEIGLETYWDNSRLAFRGTVSVAAKGKKVTDADKFYADLKKNAGWYCMDTASDKKKFVKWLEANCSKHGLDCKKAVSMVQKNDSWCTDNDEDMGWFIKHAFGIETKEYKEAVENEYYANGGFVSKGELVWKSLSASKRKEFLYENFTPEITPRSQELLAGKEYRFLPKNVKIKVEAKYANVEDYAASGRSLAATNKDRKYFNKNEDHEVRYAQKTGRSTQSYDKGFDFFAANGSKVTASTKMPGTEFFISNTVKSVENGREIRYDLSVAYNKEFNSVVIKETDYRIPTSPYTRTLHFPLEAASALYSMLDKLMSFNVYGKAADGVKIAGDYYTTEELQDIKFGIEKAYGQKFESVDKERMFKQGVITGTRPQKEKMHAALLAVEAKDTGALLRSLKEKGIAANGTTVASVWNVRYYDKDDNFIDQTQIDEKDEDLAWSLFEEFGHAKKPGMYIEWEEEADPDEIAQAKNFGKGGFLITSKDQPGELYLGQSRGGKQLEWVENWRKPLSFNTEKEANEFLEKYPAFNGVVENKAADGAEIDEMVEKYRAIKSIFGSKPEGMPRDMKVLDIESNTVHNPINIDYEQNMVIMENPDYGRTGNTLDKVQFFFTETPPTIQTAAKKVLTPAEIMQQGIKKQPPTSQQPQIQTAVPKKVIPDQPPFQKAEKTGPSKYAEMLKDVWSEAKGSGVVLISESYMDSVEDALLNDLTDLSYQTMLNEIYEYLTQNDIVLKSKIFMKKLQSTL